MNTRLSIILISMICLFLAACQAPEVEPLSEHSIIPLPVSVNEKEGFFQVDKNTKIQYVPNVDGLSFLAEHLQETLSKGANVQIDAGGTANKNVILLSLIVEESLGEEGYEIEIGPDIVELRANNEAGLFYAIQSFKQLLPSFGNRSNDDSGKFFLSQGLIKDFPEYGYRGFMLDVSRHFFPVEDVKHLIDMLSFYKVNHLHLHLSDDQGWRIEIKSWPLLAIIGGANEVGGGKGGYYTQEDYKEIVAYAAERFITIVPEIDMPGHTNSVLNAYGVLNPGITVPEKTAVPVDRKALGVEEEDPKATAYHTGIEVGFSTLDTNNPLTYQFVDDVVRELAEMTPGPYIHIGGDESHVTAMEDYIPFIEKAQDIVKKYGKISIGWDEVAHAKLLPGNIAQYWAKAENAVLAIEQGNQVLISPATRTYLDMQYDSTTHIGLHWAAYIELDDAYNWDPTQLDPAIQRKDILGVEAPLWTETITSRSDIEYMVFPRLAAITEVAWTPMEMRNWDDFISRIQRHTQWWDLKGINFYESPHLKKD